MSGRRSLRPWEEAEAKNLAAEMEAGYDGK